MKKTINGLGGSLSLIKKTLFILSFFTHRNKFFKHSIRTFGFITQKIRPGPNEIYGRATNRVHLWPYQHIFFVYGKLYNYMVLGNVPKP